MIKYVLFDLDETLYPSSSGLMQAIGDRMRLFIMDHFSLSAEDAHALQKRYWLKYGTTLRGLYLEHHLDPTGYLEFVHDLPLEKFISPDQELRAVLQKIPQDKFIVTNADAAHARRILQFLGVADQFVRIFDVVCFEYECKPEPGVYRRVLRELGALPDECALVEDSERNVTPALALGMKGILVGSSGDADVRIETIYQVADAVAQLSATPSH